MGHLQYASEYASGLFRYSLKGCREMEVDYNPQQSNIKVKGSPMYYIQGHNFTYDKQNFIEAIKHIEGLLHIGLFDSYLERFEYGKIMRIEKKPQWIIEGHLPGNGLVMDERSKDRGNIRYFNDSTISAKLYNAGLNIQHKQGLKMKEIIQQAGWNPLDFFIKFEVVHKKPHISLNNGKGLILSDIFVPSFEKILKADLYNQYQRIKKMKSIEIPSSKKDLSSGNIILLAMAEMALNEGKDLKNMIHSLLKSIPEEVLSSEDKKARRKQIKAMLEKIHSSENSEYDLSVQLAEALKD